MSSSNPACPNCGETGRVQKASVYEQSPQQFLTPPRKLSLLGEIFNLVISFASIGFFIILGLMITSAAGVFKYENIWRYVGLFTGIGFFIFSASILLLVIMNMTGIEDKLRKQTALSRWNRLYYCGQCDGFFLPERKRLVPKEQINARLYD